MKILKVLYTAFFNLCVVFYILNNILLFDDASSVSVEHPHYQYENRRNKEVAPKKSADKTFSVTFKDFSMPTTKHSSTNESKHAQLFLKNFGQLQRNRKILSFYQYFSIQIVPY